MRTSNWVDCACGAEGEAAEGEGESIEGEGESVEGEGEGTEGEGEPGHDTCGCGCSGAKGKALKEMIDRALADGLLIGLCLFTVSVFPPNRQP